VIEAAVQNLVATTDIHFTQERKEDVITYHLEATKSMLIEVIVVDVTKIFEF